MSRYTGPTARMNRRFGESIFPFSKAQERKAYFPGVHGPKSRRKSTEYSIGLVEKQKLRFMYGLTEKQFRLTFEKAKAQRGITGDQFLALLERRLDSVIYNLGFARTRRQARQMVCHGHIRVNGHKCDIPSALVNAGDEVEIRAGTSSRQLATRAMEETRMRSVPLWLTRYDDTLKATIGRMPTREDITVPVNMQLIVEFYSR